MKRPYKTYNGGKNGSGVYQAIINQIPPHDVFISAFAGNCGVLANKQPAQINIAIDLDNSVTNAWNNISGIIAVNSDAADWITRYLQQRTSGKIFVFSDPPYMDEVRTTKRDYYKHDLRDMASHKTLLSAMVNWDCNVLISHYPCKLYDDALQGWRTIDIQGRTRKRMRTERLYMNYDTPTALHDYTYIGDTFREREAYKRSQYNMLQKFSRMPELERNFIINSLKQQNLI